MNRSTVREYSDGSPSVNYYYDQTSYNGLTITNGKGRRTGMSDASGQTAWSYNPIGQVLAEQRTISGVTKSISYAYNLDGSPSSVTYPSGRKVTYAASAVGRLFSAQDTTNNVNYALNATYAPQGALAGMLNGQSGSFPGITFSATYNNRLMPTSLSASSSAGTALSLGYNYLVNLNVNTITNNRDNGRNQSFTYDYLNRIATAQSQATSGQDCWGQAVPSGGYDRYANLLTINSTKSGCTAPTLSLSVNTNNQITNSGFAYDAAGNMTNDGTNTYTWDDENRLTWVSNSISGNTGYTLDGDGKRVKNGRPGQLLSTVRLYWNALDGTPLAETDGYGNTVNEYVFFTGRTARRDSSGNVYYYYGDILGSGRAITNATGTLCYDADFYPFGGELAFTNNCAQNYKFAGMEQDSETGNYHTWFRYQAPNLGRWLSPDPLGGSVWNPQSLNRYSYALNNPIALTDPTGLDPCSGRGRDPCVGTPPPSPSSGWDLDPFDLLQLAFEPTALGFAYPADLPEGLYSLYELTAQGFFYLIYGNLDLADFGWLLTGQTQFQVMGGRGSTTVTSAKGLTQARCSGTSRALAGNPKLIGNPGGVRGTTVTAGSTAAIPSQWGGIAPLWLMGNYIFGAVAVPWLNGFVGFNGVTDTVGSKVVPNVQQYLQDRFPGSLILELNNLPDSADSGVPTFAAVSVPEPMPCPSGTNPF